jgi:hypothetical protein
MNEEDEAFEELAMKQGQWNNASGWRKKQIMEQAFPNPHRTDMGGMSLRDYFAAKAMQAILPTYDIQDVFENENTQMPIIVAKDAYALADAMLKAREA